MASFIFLAIVFGSGFAALLYQTIWQRLLTLVLGTDVRAATIVVCAFMAGLGAGNLVGGYLADRLTAQRRLLAFAACELGVAIFALASAAIYYDLLYGRLLPSQLPAPVMAGVVFLVTLWPTVLMGMSLPLASRLLARDATTAGQWVSRLYGWNTAGASLGALLTVTVLLPVMDMREVLRAGALVSAACAVAAFLCRTMLDHESESGAGAGRIPEVAVEPAALTIRQWVLVYGLSGFIALSLEIVWFRIVGVAVKSQASSFGWLLSFYLAGVGLGSLVAASRLAKRVNPVSAFFLCQTAVPVLAAASITALVRLPAGSWRTLFEYFARYEPLPSSRDAMFVMTNMGLPLVLIGPSTLFMGLSFGFLQRAVQTDLQTLGRRVGWLYAANVAGAVIGAGLTGIVLLDWLGSPRTLTFLVVGGAPFLWLHVRRLSPVRRAFALAVLLVVTALVPGAGATWARLHGTTPASIVLAEDASGLSVLRRDANRVIVFVNGVGQSVLPYGTVHAALGALPALLHPHPDRIAVIGLGSGETAFAAGARAETRTIESIEIIARQLDSLRRLNEQRPDAGLTRLLMDGRMRHRFTDGRAHLQRQTARYDIIEADALRPTAVLAGNLYSVEYFSLLRDHLQPNGFAVTWAPTSRVLDGVLAVFPHVVRFESIVVASESPVVLDRAAIDDRIRQTAGYYAAGGIDIRKVLTPYLSTPVVYGPDFDRGALDVNHDLFPKDEFRVVSHSR